MSYHYPEPFSTTTTTTSSRASSGGDGGGEALSGNDEPCSVCGRSALPITVGRLHEYHQLQHLKFRFEDVDTGGIYEIKFTERQYEQERTDEGEFIARIWFQHDRGRIITTNRISRATLYTPVSSKMGHKPLTIGALLVDRTLITLDRNTPDFVQCNVDVLQLLLMDAYNKLAVSEVVGLQHYKNISRLETVGETIVESGLMRLRPIDREKDPLDSQNFALELVSRWLIALLENNLELFHKPWHALREMIRTYLDRREADVAPLLRKPYLSLGHQTKFLYTFYLNDRRYWWWDLWLNLDTFVSDERNNLMHASSAEKERINFDFFTLGDSIVDIFIRGFQGSLILHTTPEIEKRDATYH